MTFSMHFELIALMHLRAVLTRKCILERERALVCTLHYALANRYLSRHACTISLLSRTWALLGGGSLSCQGSHVVIHTRVVM